MWSWLWWGFNRLEDIHSCSQYPPLPPSLSFKREQGSDSFLLLSSLELMVWDPIYTAIRWNHFYKELAQGIKVRDKLFCRLVLVGRQFIVMLYISKDPNLRDRILVDFRKCQWRAIFPHCYIALLRHCRDISCQRQCGAAVPRLPDKTHLEISLWGRSRDHFSIDILKAEPFSGSGFGGGGTWIFYLLHLEKAFVSCESLICSPGGSIWLVGEADQ